MKYQLILTFFLVSYLLFVSFLYLSNLQVMVVTSNSMQPEIQVGDMLLAKRQEQYFINDIISYKVSQSIVTHRVSAVHTFGSEHMNEVTELFETKGDANTSADATLVSKDQVIGNVKIIIPKIGYVPLFLKSMFMEIGANLTISFFNVSAQSHSNTFHTGEWNSAETKYILNHEHSEYSNTESVNSYHDQNGEHFQIQVSDDSPQFLSFLYKLNSEETAKQFDSPAAIVFIGNTPVLQISPNSYDDEWHQAFVDLSVFTIDPGIHDLTFSTQNSFDTEFEPSIAVKEVTTTRLFANTQSSIVFFPNKKVDTFIVSYEIWQDEKKITIEQELDPTQNGQNEHYTFDIPENFFGTQIKFWSVDLFNNTEQTQYIDMKVETIMSAHDFYYNIVNETENEISIQAKYVSFSYVPYFFVTKVSSNPMESDQQWFSAMELKAKKHHQYRQASVPTMYGEQTVTENLVYDTIPTGRQYISVKLCNTYSNCQNYISNILLE